LPPGEENGMIFLSGNAKGNARRSLDEQ